MKKTTLTLIIFAFVLHSCGIFRRTETQPDPRFFDEGVVINGVRWATRNVDMPGTFAETPESVGMFFQWGRKKAWNTTDRYAENWDYSIPAERRWARRNDPCPSGWRVPTRREIESLSFAESIFTTQNGVNGILLGTYPRQIFLPAVGFRNQEGVHELYHVGYNGAYWSSTQWSRTTAVDINFSEGRNYARLWHNSGLRHAMPIRCVARN